MNKNIFKNKKFIINKIQTLVFFIIIAYCINIVISNVEGHTLKDLKQSQHTVKNFKEGYFKRISDMNIERAGHSAILLKDGKVLITGGVYRELNHIPHGFGDYVLKATNTAEIFDPQAGIFTRTGDMNFSHSYHSSILLSDGKVLIIGGETTENINGKLANVVKNKPEIFDPATNKFSIIDNISGTNYTENGFDLNNVKVNNVHYIVNSDKYGHKPVLTLLPDRKILITGGITQNIYGNDYSLDNASLYDISENKFYSTGKMLKSRYKHTVTLLKNNKILIIGGEHLGKTLSYNHFLSESELYDIYTRKFSLTGNLIQRRSNHVATILKNGNLLVTGGNSDLPQQKSLPYNERGLFSEIYDVSSGKFIQIDKMIFSKRFYHQATLLKDGSVLITGGFKNPGESYKEAELYIPNY